VFLFQQSYKFLGELGVAVSIFLPYSITRYQKQLLFSCTINLDNIGHAGYGLLIKRNSFDFFVTKIANRTSQVKSVDSSLNDFNSCFLYPLFFLRILRFVIE